MAPLEFKKDHNMVAYLSKAKDHELYDPMVEFLQSSKIHYALTHSPNVIYESLVKQFWASATKRSDIEIVATIDETEYVVTESLIRTKLRLDDENGVYHSNTEVILAGLREAGYQSTDTSKWLKNQFCPKWRFLVHTLLQCISNKSGGWDQFSTQLGCGIVCISKGLTYNFSKFIFENMSENIEKKKYKFLMYPRFLQMILGITTQDRVHLPIGSLSAKVFASMKTHYVGAHHPLLVAMLPHGTADESEGDAAGDIPSPNAADDGNPSSSGVAADGNPSVDMNEGPSTTAEALNVSTDQPPPSPVPMSHSRIPSPTHVAPDELVPEVDETIQSLGTQVHTPLEPEITRLTTPSPVREPIDEGSPIFGHMHVSPERPNEAPITTEQSAGGAEDPITLTSVYELLNRYVKKVDNLQKELADTKSSLGGEIELLKKRARDLETQLGQQKKRKVVIDADEVHEDRNLDSLEFLAEVAQQTHASSPNAADSSKQKKTI
jgi:hypothetical protein